MKEWEPKLKDMQYLLFLPLFFMSMDSTLTDFFYMAFARARDYAEAAALSSYGSGIRFAWKPVHLLLLYALLLAWFRPLRRFAATRDPALKPVVRRRIAYVYPALFWYFGIILAVRTVLHLWVFRGAVVWTHFWLWNFPAMLLSTAVIACYALVNIDNALLGKKAADLLFGELYEGPDLHRIREGFHLSLFAKILLLLLSTAVVPMIMLWAHARAGLDPHPDQGQAAQWLVYNSFIVMFLGGAFVFGSIQGPIEGLIDKMRRLAQGDFGVKTRVYFTDEIAQLKSHFNVMVDQLKERETMRETFGRYVSVEVAKKLLGSGKLNLGGEEIEATVLFCDIRNFTPMSEAMTPTQVVEFLNAYFSFITEPIMRHNGVINKFMGDAVMAIYTPILGSEDHVTDAIRSALEMREALARFNAAHHPPEPVRFGVGIQTGSMIAGNVGTLARLEYTVIGDVVNVASRLENANKELGTDILVSEDVFQRVRETFSGKARFEPVGPVSLKGKSRPMTLYSVNSQPQ
ncbi:MAG: hypothetical protein A2X36_05380 [Elusimicrobia bacterium GWA2_69_24]|nr:MAG: hypothetical protein A2X36_05380 [Elusimicrobia bacterium GWA2_69_24]